MGVSQTKQRLEQLAEASGMRWGEASLSLGWGSFKQFALQPVQCADDTLCVFIGPDPRGGDQIVARFERRFEVNDDEKYYDHAKSVSLLFTACPGESLRGHRFLLSTVGFRAFEPFFAAIEASPVFQAAAAQPGWTGSVESWSSRPG